MHHSMVNTGKLRRTLLALGFFAIACGDATTKDAPKDAPKEGVRESSEIGTRVLRDVRTKVRAALPPGVAQKFVKHVDPPGPENPGNGPMGLRPTFPKSEGLEAARVLLPERASRAVHLEDRVSGVAVSIVLDGARDVQAQASDGYLVYERAHSSGATLLHRPLLDGLEDYLSFETRPSAASVGYRVALTKNVGGLRLVEGTLELVDKQGAPRLRVAPPYLVGADGATTDAKLDVEGCAVDRDPAPPWDRPVTAPGASTCTVRVSWSSDAVKYPAVLDPRWTTTGSMTTARQDHIMILLPTTSRVLVAGGRSSTTSTTGLSSAQLFDRTTGTWATTGSMTGGRFSHSATLLNTSSNSTTSGKVLVAGGISGGVSLTTAQLFSPSQGTWIAAGSLNAARHGHTATLLSNGRVLVAGGLNGTTVLNSAATYNPSTGAGSWTGVSNMSTARRFHSATLLSVPGNSTLNNKVLLVGGNSGGTTSLTSVQLFDGTSAWTTLTALSSSREGHTATALTNGNVLVTGGRSGSTTLASTLLFNAASGSGSWASAGTMTIARQNHTATRLSNAVLAGGQVLAVGGTNGGNPLASAELWNGTTTWTATSVPPAAVQRHTATLLSNNAVLIAGGTNFGGSTTSAAAIYDPSFALACTSNSQCSSGFCVGGVCCNSACTNQCQACNLPGSIGTCTAKTNGSGCDDANLCTQLDTCQAGSCVGGDAKVCPPVDTCRPSATCNTTTGLCPVAASGTSCSDDNVCNGVETCDGQGACKAGTPLTCVASTGCTGPASCNPTSGCQTGTARPGQTCTVTNDCTTPGACTNPSDVPDPTPIMEDHCARQRQVAVRFIEYAEGPSRLDGYMQDVLKQLNESFAKSCMSFYPRQHYTVSGTKFSTYGGPPDANYNFAPNFDWSTPSDMTQWDEAIPQNPMCPFNVPNYGFMAAGTALDYIFRACALPDEITIWFSEGRCCGYSDFPTRHAYVAPGSMQVHEVGHNSSLPHAWHAGWPKPNPPSFELAYQTASDLWDLHYQAGTASTFNRFFANYDEALAAEQAGQTMPSHLGDQVFGDAGIYLPGTWVDPADGASYDLVAPPKTGPVSCENPPDGLGACATRTLEEGQNYCYYCEFRRMYEAWNGQGSFPPPGGRPLGLLFAPGQSLVGWQLTGQFEIGFAGFEVEKGDGRNGPVIAGLAPRRTKIQTAYDSFKGTRNTMSYEAGRYPPGPDGNPSPALAHRPKFEALSDTQALLVRNALKADVKMDRIGDDWDSFNFGKFGQYPARGSWEKIGQGLTTSGPPTIVGTSDGVLISALASNGDIVFRRWRYGDAPWASQSGGTTLINGPAWKRVLPTQPRSVLGNISSIYRASDGVLDLAIHRLDGGADLGLEFAGVSDTGIGMQSWESVPGGLRGSPLLLTHQGSEGARTSMFALGNSGNPAQDVIWINQWRRTEPEWTGWYPFDPLPSAPVEDGFEVAARPNGDVDLAVLTSDGRHHLAYMNVDLGYWNWLDLGIPNVSALVGKRLAIASFTNQHLPTPFLQIDFVATDGDGSTYHKRYTEAFGWSPSETGWDFLGSMYYGRARVSHNANGDMDIVALDESNGTVRFKRWDELNTRWTSEAWHNLGGEGVTEPIAVARPNLPDVVDIFVVSQDGSLWHRPYVVPPYNSDPWMQRFDIDYDYYCGCGFVTNATAKLPRARLGSASCPCSR